MKPTKPLKAQVTAVSEGAKRALVEANLPNLNREQRRALAKGGETLADQLMQPPKDNTVWDDLNLMAMRCHQLLASPSALLPFLNNQALMGKVENVAYLNRTAAVLAQDMGKFTTFYAGIQAQHQGRTGGSANADDHLLAVMLHNDYVVFAEQFEATVRPMIESITEIISKAETLLGAETPAEVQALDQAVANHMTGVLGVIATEPGITPEQDPNVITDVEVKETVTH